LIRGLSPHDCRPPGVYRFLDALGRIMPTHQRRPTPSPTRKAPPPAEQPKPGAWAH